MPRCLAGLDDDNDLCKCGKQAVAGQIARNDEYGLFSVGVEQSERATGPHSLGSSCILGQQLIRRLDQLKGCPAVKPCLVARMTISPKAHKLD
jgi:hypothetical protein